MKTIAIWNAYGELNRTILHERNAPIGDDLLLPFVRLWEAGARAGVEFVALDRVWSDWKERTRGLDGCLFLDYPKGGDVKALDELRAHGVPCYLLTFENELICPENFDRECHQRFRRIFTWHDGLVRQGTPYVKINYAQDFPAEIPRDSSRRLACMIASRKQAPLGQHGRPDPRELYSQRIDTIQWGLIRAPGALDLYGPGWEDVECWKGAIPPGKKRAVLALYDFAICYENAQDIPGYITEKIFDCFIAGTIPVYWGAPNVECYIPDACFVDRREFADHESLFAHLRTMPEARKAECRDAINRWIQSHLSRPFRIETFVDTLLREMLS
jgi:hypothetical protein